MTDSAPNPANLHPIARANQPAAADDPVTGYCSLHSKPEPCICCLADSANDAEDCADCVILSTGCLRAHKAESALDIAAYARDEALVKLAASEARCEQLTGVLAGLRAELAEWETNAHAIMDSRCDPLRSELSTLRAKYDLLVATMAKDGEEEADPRDAITDMLCEFICEAAPMAWVAQCDMNSAHDWEKNAHAVLNRAAYGAPRTPAALDQPSQPDPPPVTESATGEPKVGDTVRVNLPTSKSHGRVGRLVGIVRATEYPHEWVGGVDFGEGGKPQAFGPVLVIVARAGDPPAVTESATGGEARCECEFANSIDRLHHELRCPCHPDHERGQP